jgi:hypothetical protein
MMGRFFVVSGLMMLSCFAVVTRGVRMVLGRLLMVIGCFLGHSGVSSVWCPVCNPAGDMGTPISVKVLYDGTLSRLVAIFRRPAAHNSIGTLTEGMRPRLAARQTSRKWVKTGNGGVSRPPVFFAIGINSAQALLVT